MTTDNTCSVCDSPLDEWNTCQKHSDHCDSCCEGDEDAEGGVDMGDEEESW